MSITEQEARERERAAYVRGRMVGIRRDGDTEWAQQFETQAQATARTEYPDAVTYGPEVQIAGGARRRRGSNGVWQAYWFSGWKSDLLTDAEVLALASCVPVTDAEVQALINSAWNDGWRIDGDRLKGWLTATRAAMRPKEDTR